MRRLVGDVLIAAFAALVVSLMHGWCPAEIRPRKQSAPSASQWLRFGQRQLAAALGASMRRGACRWH
jgi:hypothetical protein